MPALSRRAIALAVLLSVVLMPTAVFAAPPNVLILMTDQQRFDAVGCYGAKAVSTPNLDRLAREGALFERCYCPSTICTPSRASLLTGKPVPGHGVYKLHDILPDGEVLLPKRLAKRGYETSLVGKLHVSGLWHEAKTRHPNDGFEHYHWCVDPGLNFDSRFNDYARWVKAKDPAFYERLVREGKTLHHFPAELHFSHWAAETAIERIRRRDRERPFFVLMSLFDPHDPYFDHPVETAELVDDAAIRRPKPGPPPGALPQGVRREWDKSQAVLRATPSYQDDAHTLRKGYYASIALLDREIGRVLDCLDEEGLAGETLVVFTSDHGDMLFDRGLFTKGAYFYDPAVRVPLLVRWPGHVPSGVRARQLVQHMDVTATVLAAAGYSREELDGVNPHSMDLVEVVGQGDKYDRLRGWAVSVFRNSGYGPGGAYFDPPIHATMFRDRRFKLTVYHDPGLGAGSPGGELFDMEQDPDETRNLWQSPAHAKIKTALLERLMAWMVDSDVRDWGSRGGEEFHRSVMKEYGSEKE